MDILWVYMTAGSMDEARRIGRQLVESRLAACVNIVDNMTSIYRWNGELQEDKEVVLIAKCTEAALPMLTEKVKALHSYDCPCVVGLPVVGGNPAFLQWVSEEVAGPNVQK